MSAAPRSAPAARMRTRAAWVRAALLLAWFAASFGVSYFARDLDQTLGDWPLGFWLAAQGSLLVFMGVVMVYAAYMNRLERQSGYSEEAEVTQATEAAEAGEGRDPA